MRWFNDLPIARKLGLGFGSVILLLLAVGALGLNMARSADAAAENLFATHAVPALQLKEANLNLLMRSRAVRNALLDGDATRIRRRQADIARYDSLFDEAFAGYQGKIVRVEQQQLAADVVARVMRLRPQQDAIVRLALDGRADEGIRALDGIRAQADTIDAQVDTLERSKLELMNTTRAGSRTTVERATAFLAVLIVVAIAVAAGIAAAIARPASALLRRLADTARRVADGDLRVTLDVDRRDEMGQLAEAMRAMVAGQQAMADGASAIARGEFDGTFRPRSDVDELGRAFVMLRDTIEEMSRDVQSLADAVRRGDLTVRGDAGRYAGAYRGLVDALNGLADAMAAPVDEMATVLDRVAERDLSVRMHGQYEGDFARIAASVNASVRALDEALQQVARSSQQVASAGDQIAGSSQSLAQGASEQGASLEEVSASLQEMLGGARRSSQDAGAAAATAAEARGRVAQGQAAMERLSEAVAEIDRASGETARIVKTIDEIAFQTNLLALNAAVEAARAGDAGRGFAVVAEEVRSLSIRCAEAARVTAELIETSVTRTRDGVAINTEVRARLGEIDADVERVAGMVGTIAEQSDAQMLSAGQIAEAVEQLNGVTQQAAANAEESAAASEELASQANVLSSLVGSFTTSDGDARSGRSVRGSQSWRRPAPASARATSARRVTTHAPDDADAALAVF